MEQAVLVALHKENEIIYLKGPEFTLGRGLQNSHVCTDGTVSRCHCLLKIENNEWVVLDKSSNGTFLNSKPLSKNSSHPLENNDVLELNDTIKYRFHYSSNACKKRRVENNSLENLPIVEDTKILTSPKDKTDETFSLILKVQKLETELCKEKAVIEKLNNDSIVMRSKIYNLELDLFSKISSNVVLEQEIIDLKRNCTDLQKEKDELQALVLNHESEAKTLRQKLENTQVLKSENLEEKDENLVMCVIKAEVDEKESTIRLKINNMLSFLKKLDDKNFDIETLQNKFSDIQSEIEEFLKRRKELEVIKPNLNENDNIREDLFNMMETDLQCSICNEIFIKATLLTCGHTFCKLCIEQWRKQKNTCPVCRVQIKNSLPCLAIDNYVDQTIELLTPSKKDTRLKLKESHEASTSSSAINVHGDLANRTQTVTISSDSESDTEGWDSEDFSDYSDGYYHGGYGSCYICGAPDHWANGCPQRRGGARSRPRRR